MIKYQFLCTQNERFKSACLNLYLSHRWHNSVISSWIQIVAGIQVILLTSVIKDKIITLCTMQQKRQYVHVVTQARRQTHVNPCKGIQIPESDKFFLVESVIVLSNFTESIWNPSIRQMQVTFPGVEFLRALSMFKQRREIL